MKSGIAQQCITMVNRCPVEREKEREREFIYANIMETCKDQHMLMNEMNGKCILDVIVYCGQIC